jgi:hypothetical protein
MGSAFPSSLAEPTLVQVFQWRFRDSIKWAFFVRPWALICFSPGDRRPYVSEFLEMHYPVDVIARREPLKAFIPMLENAALQVAGYAGVQGSRFARHDVNEVRFHLAAPDIYSSCLYCHIHRAGSFKTRARFLAAPEGTVALEMTGGRLGLRLPWQLRGFTFGGLASEGGAAWI